MKYAGIRGELDGSKDHQFRGNEDLEKGNETIKLENESALDKEDHYETSNGSEKIIKLLNKVKN